MGGLGAVLMGAVLKIGDRSNCSLLNYNGKHKSFKSFDAVPKFVNAIRVRSCISIFFDIIYSLPAN